VLAVSVVQVSPSITILRTDGEAVWVVPRPASEQLPTGIDEIDITSTAFMTQAPIVSLKVTNGAEVRQIVKWVNAMAIVQPEVIACPLLDGPTEGVWIGVIDEIAERLALLAKEIAVVIVEHRLERCLPVADRAIALAAAQNV